MGYKPVPVARYNDEGILIDTFDSIALAAKEINCQVTSIITSYSQKVKCKGFYFRIANNNIKKTIKVSRYRKGGKEIDVFIRPRKFLKRASTITEAGDITGMSVSTVRKHAQNGTWSSTDHFFKFVNEEDAINKLAKYENPRRIITRKRNHVVPVKLISVDGKIYKFKSQTKAAEELGVQRTAITNALAGKQKTVEGYKVERI